MRNFKLCCTGRPQNKTGKKREKKDKYLDVAKELKKKMEHEGDDYTNPDWCIRYSKKRIIEGTEGLGSWRTSGDHPNYTIVENGQNTEKSPGDLRRLAVTQTPVKDHQLMLMGKKTLKECIILVIILIILTERLIK